jgi:hypothetical protein
MAYVKGMRKHGITYYSLVEGCRIGGKVRHKHIAYLGKFPDVESCYQYWAGELKPERKFPARASREVRDAWRKSFPGSWEMHQLRAREKVACLFEYRPPEILQREANEKCKATVEHSPRYWDIPADTAEHSNPHVPLTPLLQSVVK